MSEPTIDELIDWLESATAEWRDSDTREYDAIRAILEQHRDYRGVYQGVIRAEAESVKNQIALEAIRAFVERVEKRMLAEEKLTWRTIRDELAAMEKETE